jgi:hypothetical protein
MRNGGDGGWVGMCFMDIVIYLLVGEACRGLLNPIPIEMEREIDESELRRGYHCASLSTLSTFSI